MKSTLLVFVCLLSIAAVPAWSNAYSGRVYVDANRNGVYDRGERLLKNVSVSDGRNVTKTSARGEYTLPGHSRERFVFITMPSGYKSGQYYQAIQKGKNQYDFGVQAYDAHLGTKGAHRFVHISDTEISSTVDQTDWVADLRNYARQAGVAFIMHTGDICYEGGLKSHKPMMNTDNMDVPVFYGIGNHDLVNGKYGEELFERIYGPVYYSFDVGNVHYVVTPMWSGDYRPGYTKDDVYYWLQNDLAQQPAGKPIVVFNHDYWTTGDRHVFSAGKGLDIDLDAHNLKAWIYGHIHINHMTRHGKVWAICTSTPARDGIDHAASAFRTLHVDADGNLRSELRYTYIDKSVRIASVQNEQSPVNADGSVPISVNAYSTVAPTRKVTYSCLVDGKPLFAPRAMQQLTDFNWGGTVKLPEKCAGRTVTLQATAWFDNGEVATDEQFFTYLPTPRQGTIKSDWANLGGNAQHRAISTDTMQAPLRLAWVKNLGSNIYMSSPIVYDGKVYAASVDENFEGRAGVAAFDALSGTTLWQYATRASIKNTIAATCGLVFAQDVWGYLYALDAQTGKLVWERKLNVAVVPGLDDGLLTAGDMVYAGSGRGLCAFDARTGNEIWRNKGWNQREGTTCTLSLSADGSVLVGSVQWDALYANNARTGQLLWRQTDGGIRFRSSSPAWCDGALYLVSDNAFFIVSGQTGEIIMRKAMPFSVEATSTPLITRDEIIFGTPYNGLVALDRTTLEIKWTFRTGKAMIYTSPYTNGEGAQIESSPVLSGDMVLVGASDGAFYGVNRKTGALMWRHTTGAPVMTTVAVSGNMLFGADFSGNVYGFISNQ